jgi:hypothetical protein
MAKANMNMNGVFTNLHGKKPAAGGAKVTQPKQPAAAPPPAPVTYGGNNRVEGVATDAGQKLASLLTGKRKLGA